MNNLFLLGVKKVSAGFSFLEIIIATALFGILLVAALPLLNQSARNFAYAREGHDAHLAAQGVMLAVRDAGDISAATTAASRFGAETYGVWIFSENNTEIFLQNAPSTPINFSGGNGIVVMIFDDDDFFITGRAIGFY
jgi:prepilin-type N-terminal cleavage/methylation domain-containing protein